MGLSGFLSANRKNVTSYFACRANSNASTVRNHLQKISRRKEKELDNKPEYITGYLRYGGQLPKPDKPITVGIDGGYLMNWHKRNKNFEIIAGKRNRPNDLV